VDDPLDAAAAVVGQLVGAGDRGDVEVGGQLVAALRPVLVLLRHRRRP
jgi:hypothetical protein